MRLKKHIIAALLAVAVIFPITAAAQSADETEKQQLNAIEKIVTDAEGNVILDIPDDIINLLITPPAPPKRIVETRKQPALKPGINHIKGFRVQVFADGRNQATLESRVRMRANAVSAKFPKYRGQIYTFSSSPNMYCRVGNFQSQKEAAAALSELKRAFPSFAGEMRIVNSDIVVIK
ncbi:MAG: SPOR domain-containing protein [Muribaculaceae bacterium]|nr:SPOR domain-containing protein [Muribaculaceae bacterium]